VAALQKSRSERTFLAVARGESWRARVSMGKKMVAFGGHGRPNHFHVAAAIKRELETNAKRPKPKRRSLRGIAKRFGVSDYYVRTVRDSDMSLDALWARIHRRGRRRPLEAAEEQVAAGWVVWRQRERKLVSWLLLANFIAAAFGVMVDQSWVTRFCKRHHFSQRTVKKTDVRKLSRRYRADAVKFLQQVRTMHLKPVQIMALDFTSVPNLPGHIRTIGVTGG
jgi:transposase